MNANTTAEPHAALMQLYHQVTDSGSWLLHHDALQELGIRATQVALADDESLQFEPCFFRPHPEKLVPLCHSTAIRESTTEGEDLFSEHHLPTNPRPEFEAILKEAQEKDPDGDYLGAANRRYDSDLRRWAMQESEVDVSARDLFDYIEYYLEISLETRLDQLDDFYDYTLRGLVKLERWWPRPREGDPVRSEGIKGKKICWNMIEMHRYRGRRPPQPHLVVSTYSGIRTAGPDQGLTLHEIRAIVNLMVIRVKHKPFRNFAIHPVLVLSYMGPHHARILQAVYDGKGLSIQYSQMFSFEDEETAPIELFLRYNISRPVGLEGIDVCMR